MHILRPMLIHVDGASGLRAADRNGFSDPFVVVHVTYKDDDGNIVTTFVSRSQKINKTLTPQWNFDVFLPGVNETMHIVMTVMDWDRFANDDFLGQAVFPVPSSKRIPATTSRRSPTRTAALSRRFTTSAAPVLPSRNTSSVRVCVCVCVCVCVSVYNAHSAI